MTNLIQSYVSKFALCEYDKGYLAFNRPDGSIDIWQHIQDADTDNTKSGAPPTEEQLEVASKAANIFGPAAIGHFKPSSNLPAQVTGLQTMRLVYPYLSVATSASIYLWDVTNGELVQKIYGLQSHYLHLKDLTNVELTDRYIVVSFALGIVVFSRENGSYLRTLQVNLFVSTGDLKLPQFTVTANKRSPLLGDQVFNASLAQRDLTYDNRDWGSSDSRIVAGKQIAHTTFG